jgi:hypothetical protein
VIDQKSRQMDFSTLWSHILRKTPAAELAQIKALVCVRLVIQLTSAVNKRGFSRLKNIKSELSMCLGDDLLDWLMLITIEGPGLKDKDAVRALCLCAMRSWLQLKQRVPSRGNPGATRKRKKADSGDGQTLIEDLASTNEMPFGAAAAAAQGAQQMSPSQRLWSQRETCLPADHVFDKIG